MTDEQPLKRGEHVDLDSGLRVTRAAEDEPDGLTLVDDSGYRAEVIGIDREELPTLAALLGFEVSD